MEIENESGDLPIAERKDPSAFLSRMEYYQKSKKERMDERRRMQEAQLEKELQKCSFKPKINPNFREKRTIEDLERWDQNQKEKLRRRKMELEGDDRARQIRKGPKVSRSQTHVANRFVEFDADRVIRPEEPKEAVEDRLFDLGATYKTNQKVNAMVFAMPQPPDLKMTASSKGSREKSPIMDRSKKQEATKVAKQLKTESLMAERNRLKGLIHKNAQGERDDEVNYVSMNATNTLNTSGSAIRRKQVGIDTVRHLKQRVRADILS